MALPKPKSIWLAEYRARVRRITQIVRRFGFVGAVEYHHVYSNSGGAQYGIGPTASQDLLVVYAEAFERDADPEDFSLEAILAHERGHQLLRRHARLQRMLAFQIGPITEEVVASILGALIVENAVDGDALIGEAICEIMDRDIDESAAVRMVKELRAILEQSYDGAKKTRDNPTRTWRCLRQIGTEDQQVAPTPTAKIGT